MTAGKRRDPNRAFSGTRRSLIGLATAGAGAGALLAAPALLLRRASAEERGVTETLKGLVSGNDQKQTVDVTPPEDLMREHGVLDRVLLVYEAVIRKIGAGETVDPA